jgi:hypothetical protein
MSFIQTGFLFALLGLAIPVIIHLVFRQKARRVDLGTLRFLRVVLQQNARRRRVMRWLLLALRMGAIALLAGLFARPFWLAFQPAGEKKIVAVLIDRSATMDVKSDGKRLIEQAIDETKALLGSATENTRFEIALFDHAVHPLVESTPGDKASPREVSASELSGKLAAPKVCSGGTDYGAALAWARDVLTPPAVEKHLHIFTDFQRSGLAWSEVDALPDSVVSHLHDLGRAAINNVAVTEARPERPWVRPEEPTSIHVAVQNGGPFTTPEMPVVLKLVNGARKVELKEILKIEPGAVESLRFDLPALAEGPWQGTVSIEIEDDLAIDNERHVMILASKPYQILLVDGRSATKPALAATYFLEAALRLAPGGELSSASLFEPRSVAVDDLPSALEKFDVVVLADVGELEKTDAARLERYVESGGALLVFAGDNVAPERTKQLAAAGLIPGQLKGINNVTDLPLRLSKWDAKHPIFTPFNDPQLGDLQRLAFSACTSIEPASAAQVLAKFRDGEPAMLEMAKGKGNVVWFAVSCDRQWSDWTRSRLYLPMMYQLLGYQTGFLAGGRVRQTVLERDALPATDEEPGIHAHDNYSLVVNVSPRESETDRCAEGDFVSRFGLKLADDVPVETTAAPVQAAMGTELMDSEFWPYLAVGLLGLLVLEGLVANRTTA